MKADYWDLYDKSRQKTGQIHKRGDEIPKGFYHLVVEVWTINSNDEALITQRDFNKIGAPGLWEYQGGSALNGENSLQAAIREVKEESGIVLKPENGRLIMSGIVLRDCIWDVWVFRQDYDLKSVVLQEGETINSKSANRAEIEKMIANGSFVRLHFKNELDYVFS